MKTPITSIKRLALALCFVTPLVSWAATITGYEDFGDVAGVVLWRATQTTFHNSTVINVANDGTLGTAYAMDAGNNNTTSWKRFASNQGASCYTSPGTVLVYDEAGSYTVESDAQFGPMSFGGIWVKSLAANDAVFAIKGSGDRKTEFGAADKTTLFKFDKSFKIDRQGQFSFLGTVNLAVAQDAVFTINPSYPYQNIVIASGSTLAPSGAGTITLNTAGLTVNGTLDLTASTLPTISGNVRFAGGSSLVLPAGIATDEAISVPVCSGTLTADGVVSVKIGTADPINAELTISGGAITQITTGIQTEQTFTSDYPSVVPAGYTYTYEATDAATIPAVTVNGTLKTSGPITITNLDIANGADFEVVAGNTTVNCSADCKLKGNIKVDAGATLTNTRTDSLSYNHSMTVDIYGTLAMGSTRWSIPSGCTFKLHGGAQVTGSGDSLAALDIINANGNGLNVYAGTSSNSVTIEGPVRVRANETRIWVASGTALVLQGGIVEKNQQTGSFKQTGPGTLQLDATSTTITGTSIMTQGTLRLNNTTRAFPLALQGNDSHLEIVATSAETIVPVNVTSIANNNVALTGSGKANGSITKTAAPGGDLATFLQSSAWEGSFVADWAGAKDSRFDINSYGNANSTVRVTKLVGGYATDGSVNNFTVIPTVEVSGFMTLDNGYSGKVTTLTKLTGSGVFTNKAYSVDVTTLDNFTGTLATLIGTQYIGMRIGTINLSSTPAAGTKIVNVTSDSNIGNIGNTKVSVNGVVDDTIALKVKSDGIYVAVPATTVDITIPEVANATVSVTADGVVVTPVNGVVTVDIGAAVVVTYTADEGYQLTGDAISFTASASTTTVDVSNISVAAIVANVTSADGQTTTPYTSAASAIAAADDGETVTLLEATVTLTEVVAINKSITILSGNASGTTITGLNTSAYPTLDAADLTLGANVTVSAQLRVLSAEATITHPTGKAPSYRPPTGCTSSSKNNGNDTTTITFYQQVLVIAAGTNATLADKNGNPLGSMTQVAAGDTFVFTVTPAAGCALVRVTADGVELTPSEGKYSISIGSSNVSIYAVAGVAIVTGGDYDEYCTSLQAALAAAADGDTVTLLADATLPQPMYTLNKTITLNLNGNTLSAEGDTAKTAKLLEVVGGKTLTVVGTTAGSTVYGRINVGNASQEGNLTIQGGYYEVGAQTVVHVNGKRTNSSVSITGATIVSTADNGIQLNGAGTHTITDTSITGATAVYLKAGSLAISGTTTLEATGAKGAVTANNNGSDATGDALVIDNCTPPYQQITGVTIASTVTLTSANASAILVHARSGCTRQTKFVPAAVKDNITEVVATEADVFDDYSSGIDPTDPTSTQEVTVDTSLTAEEQEAAAIAAATVTVPDGVSGVDAATYKTYFTYSATPTETAGTYDVAITGFADEVTETADGNALSALEAATAGTALGSITVKPGLYYGTAAGADVTTLKAPAGTLNTTGTLDLSGVTKPSEGAAFFIKIKVGATAFTAEE